VAESPVEEGTGATAAERARASRITEVVMLGGLPQAMAAKMIKDGVSVSRCGGHRRPGKAQGSRRWRPIQPTVAARRARTVADGRDKFVEGAYPRPDGEGWPQERGAQRVLGAVAVRDGAGIARHRRSRGRLAERKWLALPSPWRAAAISTSDFANILANIQGKAALQGWEDSEETFDAWTRKGTLSSLQGDQAGRCRPLRRAAEDRRIR